MAYSVQSRFVKVAVFLVYYSLPVVLTHAKRQVSRDEAYKRHRLRASCG